MTGGTCTWQTVTVTQTVRSMLVSSLKMTFECCNFSLRLEWPLTGPVSMFKLLYWLPCNNVHYVSAFFVTIKKKCCVLLFGGLCEIQELQLAAVDDILYCLYGK